jgi:hypothetical protein
LDLILIFLTDIKFSMEFLLLSFFLAHLFYIIFSMKLLQLSFID